MVVLIEHRVLYSNTLASLVGDEVALKSRLFVMGGDLSMMFALGGDFAAARWVTAPSMPNTTEDDVEVPATSEVLILALAAGARLSRRQSSFDACAGSEASDPPTLVLAVLVVVAVLELSVVP
jgi:hypothetical protein